MCIRDRDEGDGDGSGDSNEGGGSSNPAYQVNDGKTDYGGSNYENANAEAQGESEGLPGDLAGIIGDYSDIIGR